MLGGGRALLMQLAHPVVAAGVRGYSGYETEPWRRLARTMHALYTIVFGTKEDAARVGDATRRVHARVPGAFDPDAQMWVHATLVDTGLVMYESFVGRLDESQRRGFYAEMKVVAEAFGVPAHAIPSRFVDFQSYCRDALDELAVGDDALAVAQTVLAPPLPWALGPVTHVANLVTVGLLPAALRDAYGLRWTRAHALALRLQTRSVRTALPATPPLLRAIARERTIPTRLLAAFAR
jgi:uncharacterized protein (DUF2236 family)